MIDGTSFAAGLAVGLALGVAVGKHSKKKHLEQSKDKTKKE